MTHNNDDDIDVDVSRTKCQEIKKKKTTKQIGFISVIKLKF